MFESVERLEHSYLGVSWPHSGHVKAAALVPEMLIPQETQRRARSVSLMVATFSYPAHAV